MTRRGLLPALSLVFAASCTPIRVTVLSPPLLPPVLPQRPPPLRALLVDRLTWEAQGSVHGWKTENVTSLIEAYKRSELFTTVYGPADFSRAPAGSIVLTIHSKWAPVHQGREVRAWLANILTVGALSRLLPLEANAEVTTNARFDLPAAASRSFQATIRARATYGLEDPRIRACASRDREMLALTHRSILAQVAADPTVLQALSRP